MQKQNKRKPEKQRKHIPLLFWSKGLLTHKPERFFIAAERPQMGLVVTVVCGLANMILDTLFMAGFSWGLVGAAAATAVSQMLGGLIPSNISMTIVSILYNFQLMRYAGENGVAAYGVLMYVNMIFLAVFIGYSTGVAPVAGYHYGAGNHSELKGLLKKSYIIIGIFALAMFRLAELLAGILVGYDAELMEMTERAFMIYSVSFLFSGIVIYGSSFFTALNDGLTSAMISFLRRSLSAGGLLSKRLLSFCSLLFSGMPRQSGWRRLQQMRLLNHQSDYFASGRGTFTENISEPCTSLCIKSADSKIFLLYQEMFLHFSTVFLNLLWKL